MNDLSNKKSGYVDLTRLPRRVWWLRILILMVYVLLLMLTLVPLLP